MFYSYVKQKHIAADLLFWYCLTWEKHSLLLEFKFNHLKFHMSNKIVIKKIKYKSSAPFGNFFSFNDFFYKIFNILMLQMMKFSQLNALKTSTVWTRKTNTRGICNIVYGWWIKDHSKYGDSGRSSWGERFFTDETD